MSADHLAFVRTLPCCVCNDWNPTNEAHHLLRTGDPKERGTGRKAADKWAIPLCYLEHGALHHSGDEEGWLMKWGGIDGRSLARQLWANTGDRDAALTILYKARNHG